MPEDIVILDVCSGAQPGDELNALTRTRTICRTMTEFEWALESHPKLAGAVIGRLGPEIGPVRAGLTAVSRMDARERLLVYFEQIRRRLFAGGTIEPNLRRFALPLTQDQLANPAASRMSMCIGC